MTYSQSTPSPAMEMALAAFRRTFPTFDTTRVLDTLRAREYARLDIQQHVYLDYTGGGLYAECQVQEHLEMLRSHVFGNPIQPIRPRKP